MHGLENIVLSRKLVQHYGVQMNTLFQIGTHDEEDAFIEKFYNLKFTYDNVNWFAAKVSDQ